MKSGTEENPESVLRHGKMLTIDLENQMKAIWENQFGCCFCFLHFCLGDFILHLSMLRGVLHTHRTVEGHLHVSVHSFSVEDTYFYCSENRGLNIRLYKAVKRQKQTGKRREGRGREERRGSVRLGAGLEGEQMSPWTFPTGVKYIRNL